MDDALTQLLHQGTVVYMVCIILLTFFIRRLVQTVAPSVKKRVDRVRNRSRNGGGTAQDHNPIGIESDEFGRDALREGRC